MERDWLDSLKKRMEDFEEPAPEGLWNTIESAVPGFAPARKTLLPPWLWRTATAAAVVAFGIFAGIRLARPGGGADTVAVVPVGNDALPAPEASGQSADIQKPIAEQSFADLQESPASPSQSSPSSVNNRGRRTSPAEKRPSGTAHLLADAVLPVSDAAEAVREADPEPVPVRATEPEVTRAVVPEEKQEVEAEALPQSVQTHEGEDWSGYASASLEDSGRAFLPDGVSLDFSGGATGTQQSSSYNPIMFYRGAAPNTLPVNENGEGNLSVVTRAASFAPATVMDRVDHKRPIRTGVAFRWQLGKVLGVEAGLDYSILKSTFTTISGATVSEDAQTLRYVGFPLDLTANFLDTRYLSLYASAGGMMEKCVSGSVKSTITADGVSVGSPEERKLGIDPLQWSVNAAAGVQFNVLPALGIYAEPGVSYRFASGSDVQSIYTSRPLDFTFAFGLRFSFR